MQALDDVMRSLLEDNAGLAHEIVVWNTPDRNQPSPFLLYWASDSGPDTAMQAMRVEARSYEYTFLAVAQDSDEVLRIRNQAEDALIFQKVIVEGWTQTGLTQWNGDTHDPGDKLPSGQVVVFDGFKLLIRLQRSRPDRK